MAKATFTIGVFGAACKRDSGKLYLLVNVRTDQERQRELAGLPADSPIKIVDLPGGGVQLKDFPNLQHASLLAALVREVEEETGCDCDINDFWSEPFIHVANTSDPTKPGGDIAFWRPIKLLGTPKESAEAATHVWITEKEIRSETEFRCPGKLGKDGRMGRMMMAAFAYYHRAGNWKEFTGTSNG